MGVDREKSLRELYEAKMSEYAQVLERIDSLAREIGRQIGAVEDSDAKFSIFGAVIEAIAVEAGLKISDFVLACEFAKSYRLFLYLARELGMMSSTPGGE